MLSKLRGFSNTKLAGVLIAIIIVPFVFWGMGSVFSGGNTNNIAKINNEAISTQDFIKYVNQSRVNLEYVKQNIENGVVEELLKGLISNKLLDMEIESIQATFSERILVNKIKKNKKFVDENNNFSRIKYEKFLLENNLTAPYFESEFKNQELKENLFNYISGGIKSPHFLKNKIYINETKQVEIEYFDLDLVYNLDTSQDKINSFIEENKENLKEEFIDIKYVKISPENLNDSNEFNDEFFKKIDEIENNILNGFNIDEIKSKFNLELASIKDFNNDEENELLKEIYSKRNSDKIQLIDKNDFYLLYEISNTKKILPDISNLNFIDKVTDQLILKQKFDFNQELFQKIQDKKIDTNEFESIAGGYENIEKLKIESLNNNENFSPESVKLLYSLPVNSFVLIGDKDNKIYLSKISNIFTKNISRTDSKLDDYALKSNNDVIGDIYNSYDLNLNKKYNVKLFQNTVERIKNNFR